MELSLHRGQPHQKGGCSQAQGSKGKHLRACALGSMCATGRLSASARQALDDREAAQISHNWTRVSLEEI